MFYGVRSLIGPGCVLHPRELEEEMNYLKDAGFDTSLVKVSPTCHIVTDEHVEFDKNNLAKKLGTTSKGIAPAYAAKYARTGILAKDVLPSELIWNDELPGRILCEGAQGFWLDIDHGDYPYVTSSSTLPYAACSIGFPPQNIRNIYGAAKAYDTRSGEDPLFPESLLDDPVLRSIADAGLEFGVTTGRRRKVNWLNMDKLIMAINISGTTHLIISKCDILMKVGEYKYFYGGDLVSSASIDIFNNKIKRLVVENCRLVVDVAFSYSPEEI